ADFLQHAAAGRSGSREGSGPERAVADDRHAMRLAPRNHVVLDGALAQMVEDLIAGHASVAGDLARLLEVGDVEVAHTPRADFPVARELLEGCDRVLERVPAAPVQEVAIEPVGAEALQRLLAGRDRPTARGVLRKDFGNQ